MITYHDSPGPQSNTYNIYKKCIITDELDLKSVYKGQWAVTIKGLWNWTSKVLAQLSEASPYDIHLLHSFSRLTFLLFPSFEDNFTHKTLKSNPEAIPHKP